MEALKLTHPEEFLAIARIVRPQGRKGEVAAEILTDFPQRFARLAKAYVDNPGSTPDLVTVEQARLHHGRVVLKLSGVNSIDQAEHLRGRHLLIPKRDRTPLPSGYYYIADLVGCRVVRGPADGSEQEIGLVADVEATGGADLLHVVPAKNVSNRRRSGTTSHANVCNDNEEILIPFAKEICIRIDTVARLIVVQPPEDLLELNRES